MDALRNRGSAFSVVLAAVIVCAASLAGCVGTAQPEVTPGGVNTSAPETGTTAPQPDNQSQAVSVQLAQLPIGGSPSAQDDAGADTCVTISWVGQQDAAIPSRVTVTITGGSFSTDVYAHADQGCSSGPDCVGFVFEAGNQGQQCNLAIAPTGSQDATGTEPAVSLTGNVTCLDGKTAECDTFLTAVQNDPNVSISLDPPPAAPATGSGATGPRGALV
ncbi:hypothetical protein G3T36_12115 [Diaminobutyricibacter tongyongensis]|uniref:LppP/LprE family lipoprotein n=2 Tax=Leifsonia tongyongensis TaxID=1268043 RepID=A0A6L9XYV3_9MICO|nr:hypothetical protein [Diaminobutyricibacter tongyongensis]